MVLCLMVACGYKSGKRKPEGVTFHRVPAVITNQGKFWQELTEERRTKWLSAITRADLTPKILENNRVCNKHSSQENRPKIGTNIMKTGCLHNTLVNQSNK